MSENVFINTKNVSHNITAEVSYSQGRRKGCNSRAGGRFGGWSLYLKDGKPAYTYNWLGLKRYTVIAPNARACRKGDYSF